MKVFNKIIDLLTDGEGAWQTDKIIDKVIDKHTDKTDKQADKLKY